MQNSLFENTQPNNEQKQALRQCSVMGSSGYQGMMLFMQTPRGLLNGTEVRA